MITDTHCHLYADEFKEDLAAMMARAMDAWVSRFFMPNVDSSTIQPMLELETQYPGICFPMMGLHPCSVREEDVEHELALVEEWLERRFFCAVGEIGLDLYWRQDNLPQQIDALVKQMALAHQHNLPMVLHSRNANDELIDVLRAHPELSPQGVFHCFSGDLEQAKKVLDLGFYIGIGGVLTFKKSGLDALIAHLPLDKLVLETDAPWLAPTPHRGKRNESAYIVEVIQKLSQITGHSVETLAQQTTANAFNLYGI
jgi:TatD DNase family protein